MQLLGEQATATTHQNRHYRYELGVVALVVIVVMMLSIEWSPFGGAQQNEREATVLQEERKTLLNLAALNEKLDAIQSEMQLLKSQIVHYNEAKPTTSTPKFTKLRELRAKSPSTSRKPKSVQPSQSSTMSRQASSVSMIPGDTEHCWSNKLLLLSLQRSGTHLLKALLDMHPRSHSSVEIFRNETTYKESEPYRRQGYKYLQEHLDEYHAQMVKNKTVLVVQSNQVATLQKHNIDVLKFLKDLNYSAVHLIRGNLLRMELSRVVARHSGKSVCPPGAVCPGKNIGKVEMVADGLIDRLQYLDGQQEFNRKMLEKYDFKRMDVYYEDLTNNHTLSCDVLAMMGCGCPEESADKLPQQIVAPKKMSELITDYEQVKQVLTGTKYQVFLDEEDRGL